MSAAVRSWSSWRSGGPLFITEGLSQQLSSLGGRSCARLHWDGEELGAGEELGVGEELGAGEDLGAGEFVCFFTWRKKSDIFYHTLFPYPKAPN